MKKRKQNVTFLLKGIELNMKIYWIIILLYEAKVMMHLEGVNVVFGFIWVYCAFLLDATLALEVIMARN